LCITTFPGQIHEGGGSLPDMDEFCPIAILPAPRRPPDEFVVPPSLHLKRWSAPRRDTETGATKYDTTSSAATNSKFIVSPALRSYTGQHGRRQQSPSCEPLHVSAKTVASSSLFLSLGDLSKTVHIKQTALPRLSGPQSHNFNRTILLQSNYPSSNELSFFNS
jgi:hypothetical protein